MIHLKKVNTLELENESNNYSDENNYEFEWDNKSQKLSLNSFIADFHRELIANNIDNFLI